MGVTFPWPTGEPGRSPVIAVVPVQQDDPAAPYSCAALRLLGGTPLLVLALHTLHGSGAVDHIAVTCPHELEIPLTEVLGSLPAGLPVTGPLVSDCPQNLLAPVAFVPHSGLEPLSEFAAAHAVARPEAVAGPATDAATLLRRERPSPTAAVLVVHDPLRAFVPSETVRTVVETLQQAPPECVAAVPVGPVTDTVKRISVDRSVVATEDRDRFRSVSSPVAYRVLGTGAQAQRAVLRSLLTVSGTSLDMAYSDRGDGAERGAPVEGPLTGRSVVGALDGIRTSIPMTDPWLRSELCGISVSAQHEIRVASQDDLDLAEALLAVGQLPQMVQSNA